MSPKPSPLVVMSHLEYALQHSPKAVEQIKDARAAVAELIERDRAQREALETCERWFAKHSPTAPLINGLGEAEHPMLTMLRAALPPLREPRP